jgi:hypothetical protein
MTTPDRPADQHGNSGGIGEDEAASKLLCRLLNLPAELLVALATQLAEGELAALLACRKLREAAAGTERRAADAWLSTKIGSAFGSLAKLEWAASCGMPLSAEMLTRVARHGQLEQLRWLRAHGCAWGPCKPWGEGPCSSATEGGHLSMLQWARTCASSCLRTASSLETLRRAMSATAG